MPSIAVRDMTPADEYFAGTCSHVSESEEIDACSRRRLAWFHKLYDQGLRVKVALVEGQPAAFLYVMPIEISPWGPVGRDLLIISCLYVPQKVGGRGIGQALVAAAEEEARRQGKKGLVTIGFDHDFWFMPASFFRAHGFTEARRHGNEVILWKTFAPEAQPPQFLEPHYAFQPVPGKVAIDLFWNTFCGTSDIEAERVRQVARKFGERVVLREYPADDRETLLRTQLARAIYVNGKEIGWGYEAPKEGIREAIAQALKSIG
jgi:GNAT superfamily N-acetyltransferase